MGEEGALVITPLFKISQQLFSMRCLFRKLCPLQLSSTSPIWADGALLKNLSQAAAGSPAHTIWQCRAVEKATLNNLMISGPGRANGKIAHNIDRHMIAPRGGAIEEQAMQMGRPCGAQRGLFGQFPRHRRKAGLAGINAPAGQMPTGNIAMTDEENLVLSLNGHNPDPQSHRAGQKKAHMP
jgi:hypothetical protein